MIKLIRNPAREHTRPSRRIKPRARTPFVWIRACAMISPSVTVGLVVGNKQDTKACYFFLTA